MKRKGRGLMNRIEEIVARDNAKKKNTLLWVLGVIGAVATIAGIAYAVYHFMTPRYLRDFDDDFEDDFEDEFEDDEL